MARLIKIDGGLGEGGGQVLRMALSLSTLFEIPVEIDNIRAGRPKPGLAAQHLKGIELTRDLCNAHVTGAYIGSTRLEFRPGKLHCQKTTFVADTGTAGCICLLAQVALPCALYAPTSNSINLVLKGGTNVPMGPQIEYLTEVFRPILNKFGGDFDFNVVRRGYYPKGGGEFHMQVRPVNYLKSVEMLDPGSPVSITGWSYVAGAVHINEASKMADDAKRVLNETLRKHDIHIPPIDIMVYKESPTDAVGHGSGINLICKTSSDCILGGSGLGSKRDRNSPGVDAANGIIKTLLTKSCVDEHGQDQIIILMALAKGRSRILIGENKLSSHTETSIKVTELMLADKGLTFELKRLNEDSGPFVLECNGCGLNNVIRVY